MPPPPAKRYKDIWWKYQMKPPNIWSRDEVWSSSPLSQPNWFSCCNWVVIRRKLPPADNFQHSQVFYIPTFMLVVVGRLRMMRTLTTLIWRLILLSVLFHCTFSFLVMWCYLANLFLPRWKVILTFSHGHKRIQLLGSAKDEIVFSGTFSPLY